MFHLVTTSILSRHKPRRQEAQAGDDPGRKRTRCRVATHARACRGTTGTTLVADPGRDEGRDHRWSLAAAYLWMEPLRPWLGPPTVFVAGLGLVYIAVMPPWRYVVHRWEMTDEAVYSRTGWYVRQWRVAPISRIQTVDSNQGPLEQLMGLATLAVTTASAHGAIYISGIDQEIAAETAQHLTQITELTDGDQT